MDHVNVFRNSSSRPWTVRNIDVMKPPMADLGLTADTVTCHIWIVEISGPFMSHYVLNKKVLLLKRHQIQSKISKKIVLSALYLKEWETCMEKSPNRLLFLFGRREDMTCFRLKASKQISKKMLILQWILLSLLYLNGLHACKKWIPFFIQKSETIYCADISTKNKDRVVPSHIWYNHHVKKPVMCKHTGGMHTMTRKKTKQFQLLCSLAL